MRLFIVLILLYVVRLPLLASGIEEWKGLNAERLAAVYDNQHPFRIRGTVLDAFPDDIDADYVYLVIDRDGELVYAPVTIGNTPRDDFDKLIGAEVDFVANVNIVPTTKPNATGRIFTGPLFLVGNLRDITVVRPASRSPFDAEELGNVSAMNPAHICRLGRRRINGRVTAAWNGHSALVEAGSNRTIRVEFATPRIPRPGEAIEAVGFVGTDVFRLNINRAVWRPVPGQRYPQPEPTAVRIEQLFRNNRGALKYPFEYHGKLIRLRGIVRSLPANDDTEIPFILESNDLTLPVNVSACPSARASLTIGTRIEATGICVMDVEGWRPYDLFPPIRGPFLVIRHPGDIRILSRPPWLTPPRALILVVSLVAALIGILIWNRTLKIVADRRGRALLKREIENVRTQMSVVERTRLAVELHDSIAQTLTGVAMELEAASLSSKTSSQNLEQHLNIATRALDSCRDSLRNCLWDLRNDALDEPTMDEAIRRTLLPHCKGVTPFVQFNAPRSCFSDNTTHAILCIIRELTLNALRHGKATQVRIVGGCENEMVSFFVQDNGTGFDLKSAPGIADGHFGIQGMRERIHKLGGTFSLSSVPGSGTKATVTLASKRQEIK